MKKNLFAGVCLSIAATGAFAQASNFEGPFAGVLVSSVGSSTNISGSGESFSIGGQTFVPTLEAGYNFAAAEKVVLGLTGTYDLVKTNGGNFVSANLQSNDHYSLNFKPGYAINESALVYAAIGYNHRNATATNVGNFPGYSFNGVGYGIGSMLMINKNVYARLEVQRVNYGSQTIESNVSVQPTNTVGTIGVGYKF